MKTRIISGIVMALIVAGVLAAGMLWNSAVITLFIALIAAGAMYELIHNAAGIKSKAAWIGSSVYAFLTVFALTRSANLPEYLNLSDELSLENIMERRFLTVTVLTVIYFLYCVITVLHNHKTFSLSSIAMLCAMPLPVSFAFSCLGNVINHENGLYYLLLLFNFSSICDMGAYFVGVTMGKHKLCPEISPKKTVEGAVGGIVSSIIFALVFVFAFGHTEKLAATLILTVPLCVIGMMGDLFASSIKRAVGLKDYSHLIPGHGGILDRVDSILLIAPVLYLFVVFGVL